MQKPCMLNICGLRCRNESVMAKALNRFFSLMLKAVITLPRMVLYFLQPIAFSESLFRDIAQDRKKE